MRYYDHALRVRYGDTDQMGVAYYGNFFSWLEAARTEYFRALGLPYAAIEKDGLFLPVVEAALRYRAPARYDTMVVVRTWVADLRKSRIRFAYRLSDRETGDLLAEGHTVHAACDADGRPVRMPDDVRDRVEVVDTP